MECKFNLILEPKGAEYQFRSETLWRLRPQSKIIALLAVALVAINNWHP
jgi:hypothetical protein